MGDRADRDLSRQALAEVIEPRYEELFMLVQAELRRSGYEELIAAGVVLTGGTSRMEGVVELAEEIFHMPVSIGKPKGISGLTDIVKNPIYSTGVGLLLSAGRKHLASTDRRIGRSGMSGLISRFRSGLNGFGTWIAGNY